MDEIIATQHDRAKPLTGKTFLLSVAAIMLRLAVAQIAVNLAILLTGTDMLSVLFYAYAVWLLSGVLLRAAVSSTYTLKTGMLVLQRRMGDSTTALIEIPLSKIHAIRPVRVGEDMRLYYDKPTIDSACRPPVRVRAAFALSLVSAHAARAAAGKCVGEQAGYAVVYEKDGALRCCVFRPNDRLCAALADVCGEAFGADDFAGRKPLDGVRARCLQKAFPELYPHVRPLMDAAQVEAAKAELAARRAARQARKEKRAERNAAGSAAGEAPRNRRPGRQNRQASKDLRPKEAKPLGKSGKESGEKHEVHDDSV